VPPDLSHFPALDYTATAVTIIFITAGDADVIILAVAVITDPQCDGDSRLG
jgi:hypothetical protein